MNFKQEICKELFSSIVNKTKMEENIKFSDTSYKNAFKIMSSCSNFPIIVNKKASTLLIDKQKAVVIINVFESIPIRELNMTFKRVNQQTADHGWFINTNMNETIAQTFDEEMNIFEDNTHSTNKIIVNDFRRWRQYDNGSSDENISPQLERTTVPQIGTIIVNLL